MYGQNLIIANATGCSSIYGASFPSTPYTKTDEGYGPAWANSLFEDNAEFGFGMKIAYETMRDRIQNILIAHLDEMPETLQSLAESWLEHRDDLSETKAIHQKIIPILESINTPYARELLSIKDYFIKASQWIVGGDGWAYDIGYGGIDHVIANNCVFYYF